MRGDRRAEYSSQLIERLAMDLTQQFGRIWQRQPCCGHAEAGFSHARACRGLKIYFLALSSADITSLLSPASRGSSSITSRFFVRNLGLRISKTITDETVRLNVDWVA